MKKYRFLTSFFYTSILFFIFEASYGEAWQSVVQDHTAWGECSLKEDPKANSGSLWPVLCLNGKGSLQIITRSDDSKENRYLRFGYGYFGLHLSSYFSMHGEAHAYKMERMDGKNHDDPAKKEVVTEGLYIQLGNAVLDRLSMLVGKILPPFGIDQTFVMEIYDSLYRAYDFWGEPSYGIKLIYDNLVDAAIEISLTDDEQPYKSLTRISKLSRKKNKHGRLLSIRTFADISALSGTRLVLSFFERENRERGLGFGVINLALNDALTSFEWVRIGKKDHEILTNENQLLRLSYMGNFKKGKRLIFEYEDELRSYWLTTFGYDLSFYSYCMMRMSFSYYRTRIDAVDSHWLIATALQVNI